MRASKERAFHHGLCRPQRHVPAQQNYEFKIVFMHGCRRKSVCACAWVQNMHGHECTASHAWTQKYLFPLLRQISILFGENCAWNFRLWKWRDILLQATWHASISPWNMHVLNILGEQSGPCTSVGAAGSIFLASQLTSNKLITNGLATRPSQLHTWQKIVIFALASFSSCSGVAFIEFSA